MMTSCDYYDTRLWIKNSTDHEISYSTGLDITPNLSEVNVTDYHFNNAIPPGGSENLVKPGSTKGWSFFIADSKNQKLNLFVYSIDSLRKYQSVDTLIKKHIYTKHSFTEKELENMDWEVIIKD
ncbi:hypothetical protein [Fulvivirga sediminis]|uniref:Uncharacterized protein n=1 Tax=Fulvivirga sediminis TaxID=2803949 RepID=A0A937F5B8_9BACT|nr:hypothetical protein [Fulvivirga sediminis]MBL3656702.1 hypothetical protein [Fulvivirga sediminis]